MATKIPDASSAVGLLYANPPGLSLNISFVKTLRQEIEDHLAKPKYIVTEPWVGYRFCNPPDNPAMPPDVPHWACWRGRYSSVICNRLHIRNFAGRWRSAESIDSNVLKSVVQVALHLPMVNLREQSP
jgi:hypothetical protein